jgi:hypothetical protein
MLRAPARAYVSTESKIFCSFYIHFLPFNCCRLKIFVPISILAFVVLVPVNWTNDTLQLSMVQHSDIDKLSISNIPVGSKRLVATCDKLSISSISNIRDYFILL